MTRVRIPPTLRAATGGEREVPATGDTVADILDDLTSRFPDLESQLRFANVYVDGEDIRTLDELQTPVREGATIILLPAMAGGSLASQAGTDSRRAELAGSVDGQSPPTRLQPWARLRRRLTPPAPCLGRTAGVSPAVLAD